MSIIEDAGPKDVLIKGVVKTSTRFRSADVVLDLCLKTGELFQTVRQGLRIDAPSFVSRSDQPTAGLKADGRILTVMSENAKQSISLYDMPLVWAVLPDADRQARNSEGKPVRRGNRWPDLARRGAPADDRVMKRLKDARSLYVYRMRITWGAFYKLAGAVQKAGECFYLAGLEEAAVGAMLEQGSKLQSQCERASKKVGLLERTDRYLCKYWLEKKDETSLYNRGVELAEVVRQINNAISTYKRLVSGKRSVLTVLRKGLFLKDSTASKELFGSAEEQRNTDTTFLTKMNLALYTGVDMSVVWPDTTNSGDGIPECELFRGATLIGQLAAGTKLRTTTASLRPLFAALLRMQSDLAPEPDDITAKTKALISVDIMLRSMIDPQNLRMLFKPSWGNRDGSP